LAYDPELVRALEPDQLVAATMRPYRRRKLTQGVLALTDRAARLCAIVIAIPMSIYAFVHPRYSFHTSRARRGKVGHPRAMPAGRRARASGNA